MEEGLKVWLKRLKLHESTISMVLGLLVVIVVGTLVYNYFAKVSKPKEEAQGEPTPSEYSLQIAEENGKMVPQNLPTEHVVSPKEHLWGISEKYYGNGYNWVDIAQANSLKNPGLIFSGQTLTIPRVEVRVLAKQTSVVAEKTAAITGDSYTVVKGDCLWSIAVRAYQDGYAWPKIFEANRQLIQDPNMIDVGWTLTIPR